MRKRFEIIILWLILNLNYFCQVNTIVSKKILVTKDTIELDSNFIIPNSLRIKSLRGENIIYRWLQNEQKLIFIEHPKDTIIIEYQRILFQWHKEYAHKKITDIRKDLSRPLPPFQFSFSDKSQNKQEDFFSDKLFKNGSISRGITFGNNQDMSVQSNFNLQMQGKLTKDIDIAMVATDNNIPFQADGTTAQLQEFDKVYIQLSNKNNKLIVGDYQLAQPQNTYFMNFFKRLQGANFENKDSLNKHLKLKSNVAFALTRGKFARNVFYGKENNQGPYRLVGADGEQIIVVLSGTEKIYIDGKLLQRGQEYDYIIDYNTAEITFTAKQLITKDKRIVAEFQYITKSFFRSLYFIGEELDIQKNQKVYFNLYSEQDNKNRPLQQQLTADQIRYLSQIGDTLSKAFYFSAVEAAFNNTDVFYRKKDTIVGTTLYKDVFEYSINPDSAKYRVTFSYVGANKGYYKQIPSSANGKVFQWVAPVNGVLQGDYMPYVKLDAPQQKQMLTAGYQYTSTITSFSSEVVYTRNDVNTFSKYNKGNDEGYGIKLTSKNNLLSTGSSSLQLETDYEYVSQNFSYIQRYRSMEFQRDWNKNFFNDQILSDQHIGKAIVRYNFKNEFQIYYGMSGFSEGTNYFGYKHLFGQSWKKDWIQINYDGSYLSTSTSSVNTSFYRHRSKGNIPLKKFFVLEYIDDFENNIQWKPNVGSKFFTSYQFYDWEVNLHSADTADIYYKIFYKQRDDKHVIFNEMLDSTKAQNYGFQIKSNKWLNHPFTILTTYRILEIKNVVTNALNPDNTLLSRFEYYPRLWKNFMNLSLFYETGYGLENKKEYYYVEVTPPQGQYMWIDYNNDGIKQLNEFEVAQYPDQAKYIRVYVPTNNYVKVLYNQWSTAVNIRPYILLKDKSNWMAKSLKLFAFQTAFKNDNKTFQQYSFEKTIYSDFNNLKDTSTISANQSIRQSVFFNQAGAVFGADYTFLQNANKQLLTNGYDVRYSESHEIKWRYSIFQWLTFSFIHSLGKKAFTSQLFVGRNYELNILESDHKIIYQPNTNFRVALDYKYTQKENLVGLKQKGLIHTLSLESKIIKSEAASINAQFSYIKIQYLNDNNFNTPVAYEILQSLQPGNNFTWNVSYQQNLNSYLQMSILYEGRKSAFNDKIIHIGSMQLRAIF
ncbi:MAG: hypothetical protein KatS3mg027_0106 [Bacteroidia bacterium]|nr:MAG: hypothetical protein KatS3mg027_0106 [Bacteroidia bacterium]